MPVRDFERGYWAKAVPVSRIPFRVPLGLGRIEEAGPIFGFTVVFSVHFLKNL
jgi:hypothetical protein